MEAITSLPSGVHRVCTSHYEAKLVRTNVWENLLLIIYIHYLLSPFRTDFRKVLDLPNPSSIVALPDFHKILILSDDGLSSYSLDLLARVSLGHASQEHLDATLERIAGQDGAILFFRAGRIGSRTMGEYVQCALWQVLHDCSPSSTLRVEEFFTSLFSCLRGTAHDGC